MYCLKTLIFLGIAGSCLGGRSAPVLVWESTLEEAATSALPALPAMTNSQLQNHLNNLDSEVLVMFIMNELNVEDFSGYPDALTQLQKEFESSQHAFTPSMADPSQLPAQLSTYSRVTVDPEELSSLKLPAGRRSLLLVYLADRPSALRDAALRTADATIARVLAKVKTLTSKYSAVLTGKHTTMGGEVGRRTARSLKAAGDDPADTSAFYNSSCVFIYTSASPSLRFQGEDGTIMQVPLGEAGSSSGGCGEAPSPQNLTLTWSNATTDSVSLTDISLTFTFLPRMSDKTDKARLSSWTISEVKLEYKDDTGAKEQQLDFSDVYAPRGFSYHCTSRKWAVNGTVAADTPQLTAIELPGFQVQAFQPDGATAFGRAWDCTPFFTIPIWSGLFLSLILLIIFIWSTYMLMSVPTMDRFDDPRGAPLHVPNAE